MVIIFFGREGRAEAVVVTTSGRRALKSPGIRWLMEAVVIETRKRRARETFVVILVTREIKWLMEILVGFVIETRERRARGAVVRKTRVLEARAVKWRVMEALVIVVIGAREAVRARIVKWRMMEALVILIETRESWAREAFVVTREIK